MGLMDIPFRGLRSYQQLERRTKSAVSRRTYTWCSIAQLQSLARDLQENYAMLKAALHEKFVSKDKADKAELLRGEG